MFQYTSPTEQSDFTATYNQKPFQSNIYMSGAKNMAEAIKQSQSTQVGLSDESNISASLYLNQ